jgi:hypothetical protein
MAGELAVELILFEKTWREGVGGKVGAGDGG